MVILAFLLPVIIQVKGRPRFNVFLTLTMMLILRPVGFARVNTDECITKICGCVCTRDEEV